MLEKVNLNLQGIQLRTVLRNEKPEDEQNTVTSPVEKEMSFKGRDALANYNLGLININNKFEVEPIAPIEINPEDIDSIEGERIYTSDNQLHSIVNDDGETITTYLFNPEDSAELKEIIITDKNSGEIIKKQENYTENEYSYVRISEYNKESGNEAGYTLYENGKMRISSNDRRDENDNIITTEKFENGEYEVSVYNPKTNSRKFAQYDKNKNLEGIHEEKDFNNRHTYTNVNFYNGSIISIKKDETIIMPNSMGREFLSNPELAPAEKFNIEVDYKGIKGEKSYYSNDMLESNTLDDGTVAEFSPDGKLVKLIFDDKEIAVDGNNQTITEQISENEKRITTYQGDNLKSVRYENGEMYKEAAFHENGNPSRYREDTLNEENKYSDLYKILFFNEAGMLESAYTC